MNNSNLVFEGVQLMFIGMGMVFVFLSVLVFFTGLMQKVFVEKALTIPPQSNNYNLNNHSDDEEIVAISIAVHQFRKNNAKK